MATGLEAQRLKKLGDAGGETHHRRPCGGGIGQQALHQRLSYPLAPYLGRNSQIVKVASLAVGAEHHHSEQLVALSHREPEALVAVAGGHHPLEHIAGCSGEAGIKQQPKLMPGGVLKWIFAELENHQLLVTRKARVM